MLVKLVYTLSAIAIGTSFAVQTSINAALARGIGSSLMAAVTSFGVGFTALLILAASTGQFQAAQFRGIPLWVVMTGGLLGACIVYGSVFLAPRIGIAALAAFIIAGQLAAAALIDHFGVFGVPVHEINLWRVVGIALLFSGALLVRLT